VHTDRSALLSHFWSQHGYLHKCVKTATPTASPTASPTPVPGSVITDHTEITLTAAGGLLLGWSGSGRVTSSGTSAIWILKKCISGDCSAGALGSASQWTTAASAPSLLKTCDVVAWYNKASGRLYDCAWGACTSQPFPIPAGHWGSPYKIRRAGTACGEPITKGASGIFFSRMIHGVFDDTAYLQCTGSNCGGTTNGQMTDFTIDLSSCEWLWNKCSATSLCSHCCSQHNYCGVGAAYCDNRNVAFSYCS
jgi:hypothetical protein